MVVVVGTVGVCARCCIGDDSALTRTDGFR